MSLASVIDEIQADLAGLTDEDIPSEPPDGIGAFPVLIIYPLPGAWTLRSHAGASGRPTYGGDHQIVVQWMSDKVDLAEAIAAATVMADAIPEALFQGFHRDRFGGTVTTIGAVECETFGPLLWGTDEKFGTRFIVNLTIYEELAADG